MANRGRPTKILSPHDLEALEQFLQQLPFLKKNQQQALSLFQQSQGTFTEPQLKLLKTVDREKNQYQTRHALIEQIQIKHKNQQPLLSNEIEILGLLEQDQDQDTFFRLDRALESCQKIEKAALDNRIRLENEHKREILRKTQQELTEAQKKRNADNQLEYALGGAVLAARKESGLSIENLDPEKIKNIIKFNHKTVQLLYATQLYQDIYDITKSHSQTRKFFIQITNNLWENNKPNHEAYINRIKSILKQP